MQDYGVNLICVEDGIDSSKEAGKLLISIIAAVAEMERENIRVQTMAGREQKAREGKWNGGFAPYGYKLENGELVIAEDEVEIIQMIFDRYIHTNEGIIHYDKKISDLQRRLDIQYDKIDEVEEAIADLKSQVYELKKNQIDADSIYGFLNAFNELYAECTDAEKKQFMQAFIERIDIFPERREDGNWIRNIRFQFPVPILRDGKEVVRVDGISLDKEKSDEHTVTLEKFPTLETVVLLSYKKPDGHINVKVEFGEGEGKVPLDNIAKRAEEYKPKERVTYKMIKEYIEAKYGFKVHTAYIAEVKRDLGLPMYDAPNAVEELKQPRKHPTAEKVEAIKDVLKHFEVI